MTEPKQHLIYMTCEGSGAEGSYCPMCAMPSDGVVSPHMRLDIIAMLERGDFDN